MLQNEIFSHLFFTIVYFLLVSLLRGKLDISLIWLWLGAFLGTFFLDIDHLLYWFFTHPEEDDSRQAKALFKTQNYKGMYQLLKMTHEKHSRLIFHSATFQVILLAVSFYIVTSGGSLFGSAFVLSLNLHLLKDEWFDFLSSRRLELSNWLFWQIREFPAERYLTIYLTVVSAVFLFLTFLLR